MHLVARAIRANRFARIDSLESFAIETPIFIVRQAGSPESLEFPTRANRTIRANHATKLVQKTLFSDRDTITPC